MRLRREGHIPAVLYGPKTKATAIAISGAELRRAFRPALANA